ncbi:MAG: GNAT family N-acetyltransferase [Actinomycetota bacterium]
MTSAVSVRVMRADEWPEARAVCIDAFDDPGIPVPLDLQRTSWSWHDELAFVAVRDNEVVAMVLFTPSFVDAPDRVVDVLVLSPLGVRRDLQRQGIGSELVLGALQALRDRPEPLVFLEGIPSYYPKLGFRRASTMGFTPASSRVPDEAFMAYPLPRYDPSVRGALAYADVFWRADAVGLRG